jgi:exopolysaccharide biosynthesis polyprenyl glycosylphosphotransferase
MGFVDSPAGEPVPAVSSRLLGTLDLLESILMRQAVDEVLIALPMRSHYAEIQRSIEICEQSGVRARYLADLFPPTASRRPSGDVSFLAATSSGTTEDDPRLLLKRALDIVLASILLVVLSPVMLLAAAAVRLSGPGPILFVQERFGLNKRRFAMYKFRTMGIDAEGLQPLLEAHNEAHGPVFKIRADPRVTRVGRFLRRTSIDELPQLGNVLKGEMSLVGPRPLPLRDVDRFTEAALMRRFSVKPGLTCLWQVQGRSEIGFEDWLSLDLQYIDHWSLALDFHILLRTVPAVLSGRGAA